MRLHDNCFTATWLGEGPAIVAVEQNCFEFTDQREARIGACALIVKGFLGDRVDSGQEVRLIHTGFTDRSGDVEFPLEGLEPLNEILYLSFVRVAPESEEVRYRSIAALGHRAVVLRKRSLLNRIVGRIVANDIGDEERVRQSVREMKCCSDLVSHGVADPEERVGERHANDGGCIVGSGAKSARGWSPGQ
jgi:hypothetical protein